MKIVTHFPILGKCLFAKNKLKKNKVFIDIPFQKMEQFRLNAPGRLFKKSTFTLGVYSRGGVNKIF